MHFNTPLFLFLFLPFFFTIYFASDTKTRRIVGLLGSLVFYAWGEALYIFLMAGLILLNYWICIKIGNKNSGKRFVWMWLGVGINTLALLAFKVLITFGVSWIAKLGLPVPERLLTWLGELVFPLGLSYIAFQLISYVIDVYKGLPAEKNLLNFSLYVMLFPKILVGPIMRFKAVADQLPAPPVNRTKIADGIRRFIRGLAKKVLIADTLAKLVEVVFNVTVLEGLQPGIAWLGIVAYALQIYFDFAGYTDMALGLGNMMGFHLPENFNFPYLAQSVGDFWRRWHISLSSWFRDYVFYPLERRRIRFIGQPLNILIVFLLTGLWHGLTTNFILWGLLHGAFLVLETLFLGRLLQRIFRPIRHFYALSALLLTWVFFRAPTPQFAWLFLQKLAGGTTGYSPLPFSKTSPLPFLEPSFWLAFTAGILLSLPLAPALKDLFTNWKKRYQILELPLQVLSDAALLGLFVFSVAVIASSKFLPGIYGGF
ncbi:MAG: MBOAT family protein [Anaerolineales bacterium]|nr:MBOAT family protein [Anaerolineales bacterium]